MRQKIEVYSPQNVIALVSVFLILFLLLYQIGSFLHESSKIDGEIEKIRMTNVEMEEEITVKQKELAYLRTPERIEKEAKTQMGKKLEGEKVLVFVEEKSALLPTEKKIKERNKIYSAPNWEKWQWVFLGNRE